jgi:FlaA1/EpsC-like NDP-sugar epimerase
MTHDQLRLILNRAEHKTLCEVHRDVNLSHERILVTGAGGSIGQDFCRKLDEVGAEYLATDIYGQYEYLDVTRKHQVERVINQYRPTIIINIAGAKYAPEGEDTVWNTTSINTIGTRYLLKYAPKSCRLILCSTCKSCNPETVYGASKLIAERMVLNAGGSVARFYNVIQTSGNVFEIWDRAETIDVATGCQRYFISLSEASGLLFATINEPSGRYSVFVKPNNLRNMEDIAEALHPNKEKKMIPRRRGDRLKELVHATSEFTERSIYNYSVSVIQSHNDV